MARITINGVAYTVEDDQKLLPYLRDALRLTSVKDGCSEGACGTCMVLLDGKAQKACVLRAGKLDGKHVQTVEGFSEKERDLYAYAFAKAGAVQCGFCTPGMLISAKALLDANPSPTRADCKAAIRNNICRCTGYKKIEDAILLAADLLASKEALERTAFTGRAGEHMHRVDAEAKALGTATYTDDIQLPGMLHGGAKRSAYARARVLAIHTEKALALPGVHAVLTSSDIPGDKKVGHLKKDWDVLVPVGSITHYLGDSIALVAAESREILAQALELVEVEYEPLQGVFSPEAALAVGAPALHAGGNILREEHLQRGDAAQAIAQSAYSVTNTYELPFTEHAFLEPECAVALPAEAADAVDWAQLPGGAPPVGSEFLLHVFSADQGIYQTQHECADMLNLHASKVRVCAAMVGGGFGGKEDMSVQHHAALLAYHTKRPIKFKLGRQESIQVHPKRHPMRITMTTACDEKGYLTGMQAEILADTGAYASLGGPVLQRACTHAAGPYHYRNISILGRAAYTNNPPAGAFRGFGVTQSCFATECNINQLAEQVGISAFEIRYRNAIRPGQVLPNGQVADETTSLVETLEAVRDDYQNNPAAGIACALKNSGLGVGVPDIGRSRVEVAGGKVHLHSSAACIGQGMGTIQVQMFCEETGLTPADVIYHAPDTSRAPDSGNTTASRQTLFTGEAVVRAARAFLQALREAGSLAALEGREFFGEYVGITDPMGSAKEYPMSHIAYGYATHLVELNEDGMIARVVAAHDVGTPMNPISIEGQIEGGVVMSLGYALTEDFPLEEGRPMAKFGTLGLLRADKTPMVESRIVQKTDTGVYAKKFAHGAKGIGEICSIPTPPAVALAYYNRTGQFETKLPLTNTPYARKKEK